MNNRVASGASSLRPQGAASRTNARTSEMGIMETDSRTCPECARQNLYATTVGSAGGHGPVLLPGLGGFLHFAKFNIVVCSDCGLTRFYAEPGARAKLPNASQWTRL